MKQLKRERNSVSWKSSDKRVNGIIRPRCVSWKNSILKKNAEQDGKKNEEMKRLARQVLQEKRDG